VLALFLNSGIYAQNLAARNADPGVSGAVEYRGATIDTTEGTMVRLNEEDPGNATHAQLHADLTNGLAEWSNGTAIHGVYRGKGRSVTLNETHNGTLIRQNATREFTNRTGNTDDWTVVEDTGRVRGFRMNVSQTDTTDISGQDSSWLVNNSSYVNVNTGAYEVYVGKNTTGGTNAINVTVDDSGTLTSCEEPFDADGRARVNLTNASIEGDHCPALAELADESSPYTIEYGNPTEINGTYELVVSKDIGSDDDFHDDADDGSPWSADVIYSTEVDIFFRARSVAYETTVEVVPEGELS
jgi:hypothetical protein